MELTGKVTDIIDGEIEYKGQTLRSDSKVVDGVYLTIFSEGRLVEGLKFPRKLSPAEKNIISSKNIIYSEKESPLSEKYLHITTYYYALEILEGTNEGRILEAELSKG